MGFPIFIKAGRKRISIAKEVREVSRLRLLHERSFRAAVMRHFTSVGERAAKEYRLSGDVSAAFQGIEEELGSIFRAQYDSIVDTFEKRVYDGRKFETFTGLVFRFYDQQGAAKVANISSGTRKTIQRAIIQGDDEALGVDAVARLIVERTSGAVGRSRAATIARTETHAAASYASHEATKEMAIPGQRKRWVSVGDGRTRSHHRDANGQEVGMDEPFIIRYKGQEIEMMHPHDGSGGPANNINCRCVALYVIDEDAIFDDWEVDPVDQPVDVPEVIREPAPQPVPADPFAAGAAFVRPISNGLREHNIPVPKKSVIKKEMDATIDLDAEHPNNLNVGIYWQGRSASDIGKFSVGRASDAAYAFTAQAIKETDYMAQYLGIGRVRGVKSTTAKDINGSMGGGVMALNPNAMDAYTITRRGDAATIRTLEKAPELKRRINALKDQSFQLSNQEFELRRSGDVSGAMAIREKRNNLRIEINELIDEYQIAQEALSRGGTLVASTYKLGDARKTRPWSTKEYFTDGLDKTRALVYHEFGHHVHQTYKLKEAYRTNQTLLEARLIKFWRQTERTELEYYAPSTYAMTNEKEYFVETFALYMLGKTDVAHPAMIELIEEILNERGK